MNLQSYSIRTGRWLYYLSLIMIFCFTVFSHPLYAKRPCKRFIPPKLRSLASKEKPITATDFLLKIPNSPLIVLDPGHGGHDKGAHAIKPLKYQEKILTLIASRMVKKHLEQMGYKVAMTRFNDTYIPLEDRAAFANNRDSKIFISIHFNTAPNKQADGIEIYYYRSKEDKERSAASKTLGQAILKEILVSTEANSRGVRVGDLAVIRETKMPAVLIEGGFLTNEVEGKKLVSIAYQEKLAFGIAQGIQNYLKSIKN